METEKQQEGREKGRQDEVAAAPGLQGVGETLKAGAGHVGRGPWSTGRCPFWSGPCSNWGLKKSRGPQEGGKTGFQPLLSSPAPQSWLQRGQGGLEGGGPTQPCPPGDPVEAGQDSDSGLAALGQQGQGGDVPGKRGPAQGRSALCGEVPGQREPDVGGEAALQDRDMGDRRWLGVGWRPSLVEECMAKETAAQRVLFCLTRPHLGTPWAAWGMQTEQAWPGDTVQLTLTCPGALLPLVPGCPAVWAPGNPCCSLAGSSPKDKQRTGDARSAKTSFPQGRLPTKAPPAGSSFMDGLHPGPP